MTKYIDGLNRIVWGAPALVLIVGVGLYLSLRLRFAQLTLFPRAWRRFLSMLRPGQKSGNGVTPFQALCTALAATVGTGNIVGVAGAICLGGPGAIFWMWTCGVLGMVTKYAEVTLALRYRVKTPAGWIGGPMYVITQGLGTKFTPMEVLKKVVGVFVLTLAIRNVFVLYFVQLRIAKVNLVTGTQDSSTFCGELLRRDLMQQLLKPAEGTQKTTDKASQQDSQQNEKACDIIGEAELGRPHHRLKRPDGAGSGGRRTGVAVQPRHADGFPSALIQSSFEEVRQVQVGQQRRTRLNPAPEAGHGLRNA